MNVSHWKGIQREKKPLSLQQAWDLYLLIWDEETATSCFQRKEVNSTEGIELFYLLCCIHVGYCFISIIRLKAIAEVPTFVSTHPTNKKLLRSSLGLCSNTLSSYAGCCFDLSVAVRMFRKTLQWSMCVLPGFAVFHTWRCLACERHFLEAKFTDSWMQSLVWYKNLKGSKGGLKILCR